MLSRTTIAIRYCIYLAMCWVSASLIYGQTRTRLSPETCASIKYLAQDEVTSRPSLQLSRDSKQIAYVVQVPNFETDEYTDELFVTTVDGTMHPKERLVLSNPLIGAVTWFPDNRHLAMLMRLHTKTVLTIADSMTGAYDIIDEGQGDITDYSMDLSGHTIAIAVKELDRPTRSLRTLSENRNGYRLDLERVAPPNRPRRQIYLLRFMNDHHWTREQALSFTSPLTGKLVTTLVDNHALHLNISPNGRYLLLDNLEDVSDSGLNEAWGDSRAVKYLSKHGSEMMVSYLYDLKAHTVSMPLQSPLVRGALWSPDSSAYVEVALAPVGSKWEEADLAKNAPNDHNTHLFSIDVRTGIIKEVLERAERTPLAWTLSGDLETEDGAGGIQTLSLDSSGWKERGAFHIPLPDNSRHVPIISDGQRFIMEYENASTAPEILRFDRLSAQVDTITRLNPQVDSLLLPRIENMSWVTSTGYEAKGVLLLPPDYDPSRRYPLVIENGSILYNGEFVCDSGVEHVSSFARGVLADSGVIYLMRLWPGNVAWKNDYYPKDYPGETGEAAFQLDLVESAIRYLDDRHIIDSNRVGLIGFSRGGWYTEYALAHSHMTFSAATATDNVLYSLGEYWSLYGNATIHTEEGMYDGPPYGPSLKNWLDYSISFNLDKLHTPLLIEVMGDGVKSDDPNRPPTNLAKHFEEFVGLSRLAKPVELYYYPLEQHQVDHPMARIAALHRNVDWYRFWLQGYERPNPEDPDQYKRWEQLRRLQGIENNNERTASGK